MSTDVDVPVRRRGRLRWLAVLVALTPAMLVVAVRARTPDPPLGPGAAGQPAGLTAQIAVRMVAILEQATAAGHGGHGGQVQQQTPLVCGVRVFSFDPADAEDLDDVRTVYGHHLCAAAEPGQPWDLATKLSGPLVVQLTDPPHVRVAEAGEGFRDRAVALIPPQYLAQAWEELLAAQAMAELRQRFDAATADASATAEQGPGR